MHPRIGHHALALFAIFSLTEEAATQESVAIPQDTPHVVGPGTQGFVAYQGVTAAPDFYWLCSLAPLTPMGEVAEELHMRQAGDLASFTFSYYTEGGPPASTVTAILRVYANDAADSVAPPAGLLATYTIPGLPHAATPTVFTQTYDVPAPVAVPKDLWVSLELVLPPGSAGGLAGAGAFGANPTVRYGTSHNLTWQGPSSCVSAPGTLFDNATQGFVANYAITVRVFPDDPCPFPVANGSFETGGLTSWTTAGRTGAIDGVTIGTPPTAGALHAVLVNGTTTTGVGATPGSGTPVPAATIAAFLGVPQATLDGLAGGTGAANEGSTIQQTLTVAAGDTLSFDWNFLTRAATPSSTSNDFAFVTIVSGSAVLLADTFFPTFVPSQSLHFLEETGYQTFSYTFASSGSVTIGFGLMDKANTAVNSALLVDSVQLTPGTPANLPPTCSADLSLAQTDFLEVSPGAFVVTEGETIVVPFLGSDPDGDNLMVSASGLPGGASLAPISGPAPLLSTLSWTPTAADKAFAPHAIGVTFADPSSATSTCGVVVSDVNLRPVCSASSQTLECTSSAGALVMLDGSASDADDPAANLIYTWFVSDASVVLDDPSLPNASGVFPIGVTMATLTVADGRGGVSVCDVLITVQDSMPPEVLCSTNLAALWPPNHRMVPVSVVVTATDACTDPSAILPITVLVRSDEPDNASGNGDGNTTGDVDGYDGYSAPVDVTSAFTYDALNDRWVGTVRLRAERQGSGDGRQYTIDVLATDSAGNDATASCVVVVPHDRRGCH